MKIKINDKESYEIKLDNNEEISAEDFSGFMSRLKVIEKILDKSVPLSGSYSTKKIKNRRGKKINYPWVDNKAELIKVFKVHYNGTKEQKEAIAQKVGRSWDDILKNLNYMKYKGKIVPKDLGLKYFPSHRGKTVNIKQAKIKKGDDDDSE